MIVIPVTKVPDELPKTPNHVLFCVEDGESQVYFSAVRYGEALSIHLSADRNGKRILRDAVEAFCTFLFDHYQWCRMILGVIGPQSVVNLARKCNFEHVDTREGMTVMVRIRP